MLTFPLFYQGIPLLVTIKDGRTFKVIKTISTSFLGTRLSYFSDILTGCKPYKKLNQDN